jgi:uncharacterized protein (TIGR02284 family)
MHGYDEALQDSDGNSWVRLFEEMSEFHGSAARELAAELSRLGDRPNEDGSFLSAVHRSIMKFRSLVGGLDESVLPGLIDGEERNLSRYDEAIESGGLQASSLAIVAKRRRELGTAIARMRVGATP